MWLAAVMTVALPLWLAGYVANPQRIVRIVSESVDEWMLMGSGALEALARPGTDCRYISIKPFAFVLHAAGTQHRAPCLAHCHYVGMVTEDRQRMSSNGTRGNVQHKWRQLTGQFVQRWDHQQQALR